MLTKLAAHRKDTRNGPATFTHQHFRTVAEVIRSIQGDRVNGDPVWSRSVYQIAELFARELAGTNPNFDEARFLAACGVERDANGFINFPAR